METEFLHEKITFEPPYLCPDNICPDIQFLLDRVVRSIFPFRYRAVPKSWVLFRHEVVLLTLQSLKISRR